MDKLQTFQDNIKEWSDDTFGSHRTGKPIAYHLKKEVDEVIAAIDNGEHIRIKFELADCFTLLLDIAAHEHINISELLDASEEKLEINKKRKWSEPDENGVVEHIAE